MIAVYNKSPLHCVLHESRLGHDLLVMKLTCFSLWHASCGPGLASKPEHIARLTGER